jgi:ferredoxin
MQVPLLLLAAVVVADGLLGPDVAPLNLAGVLPWIHWRGLVVLGLLAAGNVFCMGCPFLLPRTIARRFLPAGRSWPRWLRNKWPAVALLALFLWSYEALALWDRPWLTAWVAVAYFLAALVLDGLFRHAPFCKYVCPIGQFNFVQSLVSPLEVTVRDRAVCDACATKECIRGSEKAPGCELALYLPRKHGNMDCTFCLDCVHACPHGNVAVASRTPGEELCRDPQRSGIGKFTQRTDLATLVVLLVFGAFANAAGMIAPVVEWQDRLREALGSRQTWPVVTLFYLLGLAVLPALLVGGCAWASGGREPPVVTPGQGAHAPRSPELLAVLRLFVWCLVPLGAAMWLSHHGFHFFTSHDAVVPAAQRAAFDLGLSSVAPEWVCCCCAAAPGWLVRLEIVWLDVGLLLSLYVAWRLSERRWRVAAPWVILLVLLFALGVWILLEPMQMRGTLQMAG